MESNRGTVFILRRAENKCLFESILFFCYCFFCFLHILIFMVKARQPEGCTHMLLERLFYPGLGKKRSVISPVTLPSKHISVS